MLDNLNFKHGKMLPVLLMLLLLPFMGVCQISIDIKVSPNVLNLRNNGQYVTVHTDVAYSTVISSTVTLNGVAISHSKLDNQGNFVAKFLIDDIKNLPLNIGELNTLTLDGILVSGDFFSGSYDVMVVNKGK